MRARPSFLIRVLSACIRGEVSMQIAQKFENLIGVPSYHYQPVFAQEVRRAVNASPPAVIALEVPEAGLEEHRWAASFWPRSMVSIAEPWIYPFVPGDSMVEAFRLAQEQNIPVFGVNLNVAGPISRVPVQLPGAEFACRTGSAFLEAVDALDAEAGDPSVADLAREAHMARRLSDLMASYRSVLWVGGAAHWYRILERLKSGDFQGPFVELLPDARFRRGTLAGSALLHMTGRYPFLVRQYARSPDGYDEAEAIRVLALKAGRSKARVALDSGAEGQTTDEDWLSPDPTAADAAKVVLYARNLTAGTDLAEVPRLYDLLTAGSAIIGRVYAGRLFLAAMKELPARKNDPPSLTYDLAEGRHGYRFEGEWITAEPYWAGEEIIDGMWFLKAKQLAKKPYSSIPQGKKGEAVRWTAYPPDQQAYEAFVQYVLRKASAGGAEEPRSLPFSSGMRDGLDIKATLRSWNDETVYVREGERRPLNFKNALVDFASQREDSPFLQGAGAQEYRGRGCDNVGWIDPDCLHVGGCSRQAELQVEQDFPCRVFVHVRALSLITLDATTSTEGPDDDGNSFFDRVIRQLLEAQGGESDNLHSWLEVMFEFCEGKPFAYFSHYAPSQRIHRIAARHRVKIVHFPLSTIAKPLLKRNRAFRGISCTQSQYEALLEKVADHKNAWLPEN